MTRNTRILWGLWLRRGPERLPTRRLLKRWWANRTRLLRMEVCS